MNNLYPELTEEGKQAAQKAIDNVKEQMKKAALNIIEEEVSMFYTGIGEYVESDTWLNYRNTIIQAVSGYSELSKYDSKQIRQRILQENKDELTNDLNQDLLEENKKLQDQINYMRNGIF